MTTAFYKKANGVIIVYDVTDEKSLKSVQNWMQSINEHASLGVKKILIANKKDLELNRKISKDEGQEEANKYGIEFFEASAMSGLGIEEAMTCIIDQCILDI